MKAWPFAILLLALCVRVSDVQAEEVLPPGTMAPIAMSPVVSGGEALDPVAVPAPPALRWRITKPAWSASDERAFGDFVRTIGMSDCRTVDECLKGSANIYRNSDPAGMSFFADCADFPYVLRAYFAWKNGLPFSYASAMAANGHSNDLRYSRTGNRIVQRTGVVAPAPGAFPNARLVFANLVNYISTAMYRVPPGEARGERSDFYSVRIAPGAIRPGTVIYDPNGHAATVYDVDDDGRIRFIDSHPDNSVSRGDYGRRFVRASPPMGAGFKNWRPLTLVGATQGPDGSYVGGVVAPVGDEALPDRSDEQYFGNVEPKPRQWQAARFAYRGQTLDYYDYVRRAVAGRDIVYDPVAETRRLMRGLCDDLRYRVQAVDIAVKAGLDRQPQPGRLPDNIYGTSGDWETYSTPSRDARLKTSFQELKDQVAKFIEMEKRSAPDLAYAGADLAGDLARAYREEAALCPISYVASDGSTRELSFEEARARVFDFSFDPYHCAERRWGARSAEELSTCRDGEVKEAWYAAERRLRNQTERTYDAPMGFNLAELRAKAPGSGRDAPPDIDVLALVDTASGMRSASAAVPAD